VWGIHVVSPEEKRKVQWEGFAEKEGFTEMILIKVTTVFDVVVDTQKATIHNTRVCASYNLAFCRKQLNE